MSDHSPSPATLQALLSNSEEMLRVGDHEFGAEDARRAVELAEPLGNSELLAAGLLLLGTHEFRLGEIEQSLATHHRALALFTTLDDLTGISQTLNGMVLAYNALGLQEEALEHAGRSLEVAKRSGDPLTLAWAYNRCGIGHASVGNVEEGVRQLEFALELAREADDDLAIFAALNNLVDDLNQLVRNLRGRGETERAGVFAQRAHDLGWEALEFARQSDSAYDESISLLTLGLALGYAGQPERGLGLLTEAEELAVRGGYRSILMEVRYEKGRFELDRGEYAAAIGRFAALLEQADAQRDALILVKIHLGLWQAYKARGQYKHALAHHERFHELELAQRSDIASTRARVLSMHLDLDRAQLAAERASRQAEQERTRTRVLEAQARELRQEREVLTRRADEDELTGLWNRRHIEHTLPQLLREAAQTGEPLSVAMVDADHFKSINDRFGHPVGDEVLRQIARILRTHVRPGDVVARLGGEEFVIVLPGLQGEALTVLGQRLCDAVRDEEWELLAPGGVTVSVGLATSNPGGASTASLGREMAELMQRADDALYAAKDAGRDGVIAV